MRPPSDQLRYYLEGWLARASAANEGWATLVPVSEIAAAKQALGELDSMVKSQDGQPPP